MRWFVDMQLDTGQHLQSGGEQTHADSARIAHEFAQRLMVEVAIVIDRKTGEVRHWFEGLNRRMRSRLRP
jgi:hypothetical protein